MPALLCLNELSCCTAAEQREVEAAMTEFVELLRSCRRVREATALLSTIAVNTQMQLASGYSLGQWLNADRRNGTRWSLIRAMQAKAPFQASTALGDDVEYTFQGQKAAGLGLADVVGGLAVSLPLAEEWAVPRVSVTRTTLVETEEGEPVCREDCADLPHASSGRHLGEHEEHLKTAGIDVLTTGDTLWEAREEFFPNLRFLPRVEDDVRGMQAGHLLPVRQRLVEMEAAVSAWAADESMIAPEWRSKKADGEHDQRRLKLQFTDVDGVVRFFAEHLYFTPGHNRIYFRTDTSARTIIIAWIGPKVL